MGTQTMIGVSIVKAGALVIIVGLVLIFASRMLAPPPPRIPRIVDEHGNNLIYTCPGDPRCTPVVR